MVKRIKMAAGFSCIMLLLSCAQPPSDQNGNANSSASSTQSSSQPSATPAPTPPDTPTPVQSQSTPQPSLPPGQARVTKEELGDAWPLTVDEGILACEGSGGVGAVVFIAKGITFALNGHARAKKIYQEIDFIQAKDPKTPGVKKSVGPLIDRGLKLCQ